MAGAVQMNVTCSFLPAQISHRQRTAAIDVSDCRWPTIGNLFVYGGWLYESDCCRAGCLGPMVREATAVSHVSCCP